MTHDFGLPGIQELHHDCGSISSPLPVFVPQAPRMPPLLLYCYLPVWPAALLHMSITHWYGLPFQPLPLLTLGRFEFVGLGFSIVCFTQWPDQLEAYSDMPSRSLLGERSCDGLVENFGARTSRVCMYILRSRGAGSGKVGQGSERFNIVYRRMVFFEVLDRPTCRG